MKEYTLKDFRRFILNRRNGNGLSTCKLCEQVSWDRMCYNLEIYCYETKLRELIICSECREHLKGIDENESNI